MRALIQRVTQASVDVGGERVGACAAGVMVLLGVGADDTATEAQLLADKTAQLRIFADAQGRFNHSLLDVGGEALVVSQFTLYADVRKGRRPSFSGAAAPDQARVLVDAYVAALRTHGVQVETGVFGAMMQVSLINDGPVTIWLDSDLYREPRRGGNA